MQQYMLDDNQMYAFNLIERTDSNVFIQGAAGTGKSVFVEYLRANSKKKIWCLCPTGMAALNIKGETIHKGFRLPPVPYFEPEALKSRVMHSTQRDDSIRHFDVILIDEISMVNPNLLDAMDYLARRARKDNRPFGGMQVVIIGDLYQLPPVIQDEALHQFRRDYGQDKNSFYCFDSHAYKRAKFISVVFTKNYRQNSAEFINELDKLRKGNPDCLSYFNRQKKSNFTDSDDVITITPRKVKADAINKYFLDRLDTPQKTYTGKIVGDVPIKNLPVPTSITLKPGALVIFCKNGNDGYTCWSNGSMGKIVELADDHAIVYLFSSNTNVTVDREKWENITYKKNPETKEIEVCQLGTYEQLPLTLGYAITIHKAQGKTLDSVRIDLDSGAWIPGQTYTALSRARRVEDIQLTRNIFKSDIPHHYRVNSFFSAQPQ
ncbi:MAG: hypothetical protein E7011_04000 [Alphaproteobacteria bacterium]|nr:hypothetical protein [Alphaproteobacteria bacterium]